MHADKAAQPSDDPYGIADEVDDIAESWDPDSPELPAVAFDGDSDWLRKRQIAHRLTAEDIRRTEQDFDREAERLKDRRAEVLRPMNRRLERIKGQLVQYMRALQRDAEREGRQRPSKIETPHGTITSKKPSVPATVEVLDETKALNWLKARDMDDYIRRTDPKPATEKVDIVAIRKAIAGEDIVSEDGEACPHLRVHVGVRREEVIDPT